MRAFRVGRILHSASGLFNASDHKISRIQVWSVPLHLVEGSYKWASGKSVTKFDSTYVALHTESGLIGVGENCPLGPSYLPAFSLGTRAGLLELVPALLGQSAVEVGKINETMDQALKGHPYVKSAVDIACWDILGQVCGTPLAELFGGRYEKKFPLYRAISQGTPQQMTRSVEQYRSEGYQKFQLKVGGDAYEDIRRIRAVANLLNENEILMADANTGWLMHDAVRVINRVKDVNVYIEQPCLSYEENLSVRRMCPLPFILDESVTDVHVLMISITTMPLMPSI